jgi:hypothetical protein
MASSSTVQHAINVFDTACFMCLLLLLLLLLLQDSFKAAHVDVTPEETVWRAEVRASRSSGTAAAVAAAEQQQQPHHHHQQQQQQQQQPLEVLRC